MLSNRMCIRRYNHTMPKKTPPLVELDELLAAEYNYISQTANQANEDRARVSSFYLIAVGSLVAALLAPNSSMPTNLQKPSKSCSADSLFC